MCVMMTHMILFASLLLLPIVSSLSASSSDPYQPNWDSLDKRPLPGWYDEAKVGIFIHWGMFSVPSFRSEWFWWYWKGSKPVKEVVDYMNKNYRPDFTYADFAKHFTADLFDPYYWADILNNSGAKYIVLTSKHHEGFCNWDTSRSFNWNSMDVGPNRNLVGELATAIRNKTKLKFGLYHSLFEWFNPLYLSDSRSNFSSQDFVRSKTMPELHELVNKFHPELIWSDGDAGPDTYWNSTHFLAWLYNHSPVKDEVVTNDRWGDGCACKHGGYYTCDDRYNPGHLLPHKWENCFTLDKDSWGYRREAKLSDYLTMEDIASQLASTVSCGGNVLINIGPRYDGMIDPVMEERLRQLGQWLNVNGESIYSSKPWKYQNDTVTHNIWYTSKNNSIYAIVLNWPTNNTLTLGSVSTLSTSAFSLLGFPGTLSFKSVSRGTQVSLPDTAYLKLKWAWVIKCTNVTPTAMSEPTLYFEEYDRLDELL